MKTIYIGCMSFLLFFSSAYAVTPASPLDNQGQWIKNAVYDVFDLKNQTYTQYIDKNYVEQIDGKTYDFQQWVQHMNDVKSTLKSYRLTFNRIVTEGDYVAVSYDVNAIKKDGSPLAIHIVAIFTVKNNKILYADELTHTTGNMANYAK